MIRAALSFIALCPLVLVLIGEAAASDMVLFTPAQFDEARGALRFESSSSVDWRGAATRQALGFDWRHPAQVDIARLRNDIWEISNAAEIRFPVALPAGERRATHSLISAAGIHPLTPNSLEGTARFHFDHGSPPVIVNQMFFGVALADAPETVRGGGFVVRSTAGERPVAVPATIGFDPTPEGRELRYADQRGRLALRLPDPWFAGSDTAFGFTFAGKRYLFVAWLPDRIGAITPLCEANHSIYLIEQTLTLIAGNSYGCDP